MMGKSDIIGAFLAVISAVISNFGVNVQKYSHSSDALLPKSSQKAYVMRPLWWIGLIMVVGGSIGDFVAFGYATQALVASLGGGSTLIANMIFAHYFNKEVLRQTDFIGVIWIVAGVVIVALITDPNQDYSLEELEMLFVRPEFVIYSIFVGLCIMCLFALIKVNMSKQLNTTSDVKGNVAYYYASMSGIVGAISVLLAKCSALMIARTINGHNELKHPVTYIFLGGMLISILLQTHLLNVAICFGETMKVYPIFQIFWIGFSVIGGIVFYETAHTFSLDKWILYPVSLFCVIIGVYYLIQRQPKTRHITHITTQTINCSQDAKSGEESLQSPLLSGDRRTINDYDS